MGETAAVEGYTASTYGDAFADVYDDWYGRDPAATNAAVAVIARLSGGRPALELGVGSGRLAAPLAAGGVPVVGVDASLAMLHRLRAKEDGRLVAAVAADMAALPVRAGAGFGVVYVACNTLFNLPSAAAQRTCIAAAAAALAPGGFLAVEAFVPADEPGDGPAGAAGAGGVLDVVEVRTIAADAVVLTVSRHEPTDQTVTGQHIEICSAGGVRLRPWHVRYSRPEELDSFAADAGLGLVSRWEGWSGAPFDESSANHVSVYGQEPA